MTPEPVLAVKTEAASLAETVEVGLAFNVPSETETVAVPKTKLIVPFAGNVAKPSEEVKLTDVV